MSGAEEGAQDIQRVPDEWVRAYGSGALAEALADADFWEEWARGNARRIAVREAERDRYRLAWLSARRRAVLESVHATELVERAR